MKKIESYHMSDQYEALISKVRQCAPSSLSEALAAWTRLQASDEVTFDSMKTD